MSLLDPCLIQLAEKLLVKGDFQWHTLKVGTPLVKVVSGG